ncbi:hypothetical protein [Adlercreutzia sp. ZJ242]|uniref:hypothetical protein n=1 Tax=Adlercreutzia sp. ZJ242 TaxID=2709409 RepID=UPI0013ED956B|nr:hypothetical protein [Adlercreutzia sp. ZJ242]
MMEKALFTMAAIAAVGEFVLDVWKECRSRADDEGKSGRLSLSAKRAFRQKILPKWTMRARSPEHRQCPISIHDSGKLDGKCPLSAIRAPKTTDNGALASTFLEKAPITALFHPESLEGWMKKRRCRWLGCRHALLGAHLLSIGLQTRSSRGAPLLHN